MNIPNHDPACCYCFACQAQQDGATAALAAAGELPAGERPAEASSPDPAGDVGIRENLHRHLTDAYELAAHLLDVTQSEARRKRLRDLLREIKYAMQAIPPAGEPSPARPPQQIASAWEQWCASLPALDDGRKAFTVQDALRFAASVGTLIAEEVVAARAGGPSPARAEVLAEAVIGRFIENLKLGHCGFAWKKLEVDDRWAFASALRDALAAVQAPAPPQRETGRPCPTFSASEHDERECKHCGWTEETHFAPPEARQP